MSATQKQSSKVSNLPQFLNYSLMNDDLSLSNMLWNTDMKPDGSSSSSWFSLF